MRNVVRMLIVLSFLTTMNAYSDTCTKKEAQGSVEWACKEIAAKGKAALDEIAKYRFCGPNYVWIQDADVKMVLHPIKIRLNGKDLKPHKDENGKHLFVEFDKMAKANAAGGWVDYLWAKPGQEKATPKTSFVKLCGGGLKWIAGSGVWKDELK